MMEPRKRARTASEPKSRSCRSDISIKLLHVAKCTAVLTEKKHQIITDRGVSVSNTGLERGMLRSNRNNHSKRGSGAVSRRAASNNGARHLLPSQQSRQQERNRSGSNHNTSATNNRRTTAPLVSSSHRHRRTRRAAAAAFLFLLTTTLLLWPRIASLRGAATPSHSWWCGTSVAAAPAGRRTDDRRHGGIL